MNIIKRWSLLSVLMLSLVMALASEQPNVLIIMLDDLNDYTGFLQGHPQVKTPHMDALAEESVIFTNAQTNAPICAPSRASMFNGIYPHVSQNYWFDEIDNNEVLSHSMTLSQYMTNNGYQTYGTGKLLHSDKPHQWTLYGPHHYFGPYPWNGKERVGHPSIPAPFRDYGVNDGVFSSLADIPEVAASDDVPGYKGWYDHQQKKGFRYVSDQDRDSLSDEILAAWAVNRIKAMDASATTTPFMLAVGFSRPHTPLIAPQKYFDMYPKASLQLPVRKAGDKDDTYYRSIFTKWMPEYVTHYDDLEASWGDSDTGLRAYVQAYLACVSFADEQVGRVMDALRNSRFNDNTLVILVSDHGYNMGEKEHLFKNALWEESTRIPMLVRPVGIPQAMRGVRESQPVSLIDIYPTIKEVCALTADTKISDAGVDLDGHSLVPLLTSSTNDQWDGPAVALTNLRHAYSELDPMVQNYSVRSKNFRYTLYTNGKEELYDHTKDEYEWDNVADEAAYSATKDSLKAELMELVGPYAFPQNEEEKLLDDPGFESGNLDKWSESSGTRSCVSSPVNSGSYAAKIQDAGRIAQVVRLKPNTSYELSCSAKAEGELAFLGITDIESNTTVKNAKFTSPTYEKKSIVFETGTEYKDYRVWFWTNTSGNYYVDDFSLRDLNASALNNNALQGLAVYPNPVIDVLNVSFSDCAQVRLDIFDLYGRVVFSKDFVSCDDISVNTSGILKKKTNYIIRLQQNDRVYSQTIAMA